MIKPGVGSEYRGGMLGKGLALVKEVSAGMILSSEAILRQFISPPLAKLQRLYIQINMQNKSPELQSVKCSFLCNSLVCDNFGIIWTSLLFVGRH